MLFLIDVKLIFPQYPSFFNFYGEGEVAFIMIKNRVVECFKNCCMIALLSLQTDIVAKKYPKLVYRTCSALQTIIVQSFVIKKWPSLEDWLLLQTLFDLNVLQNNILCIKKIYASLRVKWRRNTRWCCFLGSIHSLTLIDQEIRDSKHHKFVDHCETNILCST